jgi:predicted nucleic acid-binding protein
MALEPLCEIHSSIQLYHQALDISERWRYSFYDALIISAALQSSCKILYSEDLQHDQNIHDIRIINPFL